MKKIYLYAGMRSKRCVTTDFVLVSDKDFAYLNQWRWFKMSIYHTDNKIYYARRYERPNGKVTAILMHRAILGLTTREQKADHINGDGLDNRRENLREVNHSQNMSNKKSHSNSSSKYLGVSKEKSGKFNVACKYNEVKLTRRGFESEKEAALVYNELALQLKGEYARLNIV